MTQTGSRIRYLVNRLLRRICSYQKWLILRCELNVYRTPGPASSVELKEAGIFDIPELIMALPNELVGHLPKTAIDSMVKQRFNLGIRCFIALFEGRIVGGCWSPPSHTAKFLNIKNAAEITTLFVTSEGRGQGIGTLLCRYVCTYLARSGTSNCISLVWYSRPASIKAHLNAGFVPIGEKKTISLLGIRWSRFSTFFDR